MKRGYLLPEGCKDLIDVLELKPRVFPKPEVFSALKPQVLKMLWPGVFSNVKPQVFLKLKPKLPPIVGEI